MQDDQKGRLTTLLLISALFAGGFLLYEQFLGEPPTPAPTSEGQESPPVGTEEREPEPELDVASRLDSEQLFTIETDDFRAELTNLNTGVRSVRLYRERYKEDDGSLMEVVTNDAEAYLPAQPEFGGIEIPPDAIWTGEQVSEREVHFSYRADGVRISRKVEAGVGPYQMWITTAVENLGDNTRPIRLSETTAHYVSTEDESGGMFASRSPKLSHGLCYWGDDEVTRLDSEGALPEGNALGHGLGPDVKFSGVEDAYFVAVLAPSGRMAERCQIRSSRRGGTLDDPEGTLFESRLIYPRVDLEGHGTQQFRTLAYIGPKDADALHAAGHHLSETIDLGWFSAVAGYFVEALRLIYGFVGNWGLAIILLTVCLRLLLLPLTWQSFKSMGRMRLLKPEMDRINELYKDDREKKGMAMMELYRKEKVSPLGGCLPQLLQMPIFFAFYASLSTNVELYRADFTLWWTDLSSPDPYYSLPLLLGALMHFQQRITPAAIDPKQQKIMMYMMPIMITSFMLFLPSGLCLYMVTNSVLGIAQQQYIHRKLGTNKAKAKGEDPAGGGGDDSDPDSEESPNLENPTPILATGGASSSSVVSRTKPKKKKPKRRSRRA